MATVICSKCADEFSLKMCMKLRYPMRKTQWKCLPCSLGSKCTLAYEWLMANSSKKLYEAALIHEVDRTKLLALVRWHRAHNVNSKTHEHTPQSIVAIAKVIKSKKNQPLYSKEMLEYAVEYAMEHACGCRAAARAAEIKFKLPINSIPHTTVHDHIKSPTIQHSRAGARRRLSPFEEEFAAQYLIQQQATAPLTKRAASDAMVALLCRRGRPNPFQHCVGQRPSEGFWRGFLQRHPEIQLQKAPHSN